MSSVGTPELWRYTADALYLIENPIVREAFFPSGAQRYAVESARARDQRHPGDLRFLGTHPVDGPAREPVGGGPEAFS